MKHFLLVVFIFIVNLALGQNLIVDPGAEVDPPTNGWVVVSGGPVNPWGCGSEVPAHTGSYHFYAANNSPDLSETYQDVDVSAFASSIDASASTFNFSVWQRVYSFTGVWNDKGRVYVEYRDASSTILSTFNGGWQNTLTWTQYSDVRIAPVGTRTIRVRLVAAKQSGTAADGYFDDLVLTHTSSALPVDLVSFTSSMDGDAVALNWQTSREKSNDFFTLEKSSDGINWAVLSTQKGSAAQGSSYQYIDNQLTGDLAYYRLSQKDIDGTTTAFPILTQKFNLSGQGDFVLYPNPSSGQTNISIAASGEKTLRVFSLEGKLLREVTFEGNEYSLDLTELSVGHYIVEILTTGAVKRKALIKY